MALWTHSRSSLLDPGLGSFGTTLKGPFSTSNPGRLMGRRLEASFNLGPPFVNVENFQCLLVVCFHVNGARRSWKHNFWKMDSRAELFENAQILSPLNRSQCDFATLITTMNSRAAWLQQIGSFLVSHKEDQPNFIMYQHKCQFPHFVNVYSCMVVARVWLDCKKGTTAPTRGPMRTLHHLVFSVSTAKNVDAFQNITTWTHNFSKTKIVKLCNKTWTCCINDPCRTLS